MNRPHPYRRQDSAAFERDCDAAYLVGRALLEQETAARIEEFENSPEQADWDADDAE